MNSPGKEAMARKISDKLLEVWQKKTKTDTITLPWRKLNSADR